MLLNKRVALALIVDRFVNAVEKSVHDAVERASEVSSCTLICNVMFKSNKVKGEAQN